MGEDFKRRPTAVIRLYCIQ